MPVLLLVIIGQRVVSVFSCVDSLLVGIGSLLLEDREVFGTTIRWRRFRRSGPDGVSTMYDRGVPADDTTSLRTWWPLVLTHTSMFSGISGSRRTRWLHHGRGVALYVKSAR